jgi:hypothetical protein
MAVVASMMRIIAGHHLVKSMVTRIFWATTCLVSFHSTPSWRACLSSISSSREPPTAGHGRHTHPYGQRRGSGQYK